MPIRIVEDEGQDSPDNSTGSSSNNGGNGGGSNGSGILGLLLPLLFRYPKLLIVVIILCGGYYFLGKGCNPSKMASSNTTHRQLATGGVLDEKQFDKAEVFEALADNSKNPLPDRVSLEQYAPKRMNQGQQGSCVAWSSAYAARTILRAIQTGEDPNSIAFSPSFLYNQIKIDENCQGSYVIRAMETMSKEGVLPLSQFPYDDQSCGKLPTGQERNAAGEYRMAGANRLTRNGDDYKIDILAMKQNLAQGAPVVIGMMVGGSFMQEMMGKKVWIPNSEDYDMSGYGGHAMCVIGYDDFLEGGSFQIMNSWGPEWGDNGLAWVRYKDFERFAKEAYGTYPMGNAAKPISNKLDVQIGLINNDTKKNIALAAVDNNIFHTKSPITIGTKFKMEVTNSIECFTYIFGKDTDASSYVLFPYTLKHSPFCGIVGTRVFPRDYSMQADKIGTKDDIAIIVTKTAIDYKGLNEKINQSKGDFAAKVNNAIADLLIDRVAFKTAENISFSCNPEGKNAVAVIVEIDKQ